MRLINALYLPPGPPSITYRVYAEDLGGFTLLGWLLERLLRRIPVADLVILTQDEVSREAARRIARPWRVAVLASGGETRLDAMAELARVAPGSHIACFWPELAFAPSRMLWEVWAQHIEHDHRYTRTLGVPSFAGVEIFDSGLLRALGGLRVAGAELSDAAARLLKLRPDLVWGEYGAGGDADDSFAVRDSLDLRRAQASLEGLPEDYGFDALELWKAVRGRADSPPFGLQAERGYGRRVLYVTGRSGYSGGEESLRTLAVGVGRLGWEQYAVVGLEGVLADRLREAGAAVYCPNWPFTTEGEDGERFAHELLDGVQPDVVHCNSDPGAPLLREARRRGIPTVMHVRVPSFEGLEHVLEEASACIAVSEYVKRRLVGAGVPGNRIRVAYDGVETDRFRPGVYQRDAVREELGLPGDAFIVLLIARLAENKRHDLVLEAAAAAGVPDLHLVFVGRHGDLLLLRSLESKADLLGLTQRLTWLPFQEDIRKVECAADVLVLCSEDEPAGTCVLEAMALGMPVVVSDAAGTCELVEAGVSGWVVGAGDAAGLAAALRQLAADPSLRSSVGKAARERAERLYTVEAHAESVCQLFAAIG
ncbi:MAG: glycosyltransferase family 4 protein [Bryobacteraceae bacterium]|nr:glycosyltransferase family 4 protein [Bryobacteraceae bacterium]